MRSASRLVLADDPASVSSAFIFPRRVVPFCGILAAVICSAAFVLPPFPLPRHYYFTFSPLVAYLQPLVAAFVLPPIPRNPKISENVVFCLRFCDFICFYQIFAVTLHRFSEKPHVNPSHRVEGTSRECRGNVGRNLNYQPKPLNLTLNPSHGGRIKNAEYYGNR